MRNVFSIGRGYDKEKKSILGANVKRSSPASGRKRDASRFSLVDRKLPYYSGISRFGETKTYTYFSDPFHTLLNLPWPRFLCVFFMVYLTQFLFFALLYWSQSYCIIGLDAQFSHALWMSSRVSSTLGFTDIQPNPNCPGPNLTVIFQVIVSSLLDFVMLGMVFARFSAPYKRAETIRFSSKAVVHRHPSGSWCLSLKVANMRKHQILSPDVKVLLTAIDSITPKNYVFEYLTLEDLDKDKVNLQLGFPAELTHIITPASPLWLLSLQEMDTRNMELLVFVDGVDAMTSKQMQARMAYYPEDLLLNEVFLPMHLEVRHGKLGLDFSHFDVTACDAVELAAEYEAGGQGMRNLSMPQIQRSQEHLRHYTFKRLTEQGAGKLAAAPAPAADTGAEQDLQPRSMADVPLL